MATPCDGAYTFWHQGMSVLALAKTTTVPGGDYTYWHQGMSLLRLLGTAPPVTVPAITSTVIEMPVPTRTVVGYW